MKKLLVLVFAIALCLGVLCLGASADGITLSQPTGSGTAEKPYQIGTAVELYWFAEQVNRGKRNINAELTANITINENVLNDGSLNTNNSGTFREWTPIGTNRSNAYTGTFDGRGYTISGLYDSGSGQYAGLFGYVGGAGEVKNVSVEDSYISHNGASDTGGVCGWNDGTITNCSNSGTVTNNGLLKYVGGVCGWNDGTIENCYNRGSVSGVRAGGVCGGNEVGGTITNCYNTGSVTGNSGNNTYTGGVCGNNEGGEITNCYNTGSVAGSGIYTDVGGVCGGNEVGGTITNCYNTGVVNGENKETDYGYINVGGVCGGNKVSGTITNCYNTGSVSGNGFSNYAGGVCGENSGTIDNCYWHEDTVLTGYGINTGKVTSVEDKTTGEFASGEVAWLLNQGQENGPWRQNIVTDTSPVLNSKHGSVIKVTVLDETSTDYYGNGNHVTLPNPSPNEAYFNSSGEYIDPASYSFTDGETVYLKTAVKITVVYGNDTEDEIKYVASGDTFKLPAAPSKSGYTFVGWSDGSKTYEAGESVTVTGDMTFTAVWQAINIPDPNGITVTQPSNGTVKVNPSNGSAGTLITVTATPDEGYELAYITVDGEKISGNTFRMPDKSVTVSAVFVSESFPFVDVKSGDWFFDYVAYVYANGLMDGVSASEFNPDGSMTRAMVWAILARIDGETVTGANWLETARAWAMAEGVSDGTDANGLVTREQLATMLWRYAGEPDSDYSLSAFTDAASVSEWAETAMSWAVENGLITGVTANTLVPSGSATRAQCAAILMRYVENI